MIIQKCNELCDEVAGKIVDVRNLIETTTAEYDNDDSFVQLTKVILSQFDRHLEAVGRIRVVVLGVLPNKPASVTDDVVIMLTQMLAVVTALETSFKNHVAVLREAEFAQFEHGHNMTIQ